jgi:hypothetical protein
LGRIKTFITGFFTESVDCNEVLPQKTRFLTTRAIALSPILPSPATTDRTNPIGAIEFFQFAVPCASEQFLRDYPTATHRAPSIPENPPVECTADNPKVRPQNSQTLGNLPSPQFPAAIAKLHLSKLKPEFRPP